MTPTIVVAAPGGGALADRVGPRLPTVAGPLALAVGLLPWPAGLARVTAALAYFMLDAAHPSQVAAEPASVVD
jgi:hypothetical protein